MSAAHLSQAQGHAMAARKSAAHQSEISLADGLAALVTHVTELHQEVEALRAERSATKQEPAPRRGQAVLKAAPQAQATEAS